MESSRGAVHDHRTVLRDHGYHQLVVARVVPETDDASSLVLDVPDDLRDAFAYRPGQFCTFRVKVDGADQLRSYSMSSAPETDADLTVTIKRVAGGLVSNWLLDHVRPGDRVEVTRPAGVFCPYDTKRPVIAFCGGSGITPVMSIMKHLLAVTDRSVSLLYANRDGQSIIFGDALSALAAGSPGRFDVFHHLDSERGLLSEAAVGSFVGGRLEADCYICGPGPFMDLVESTLRRAGIPDERIFIERFLVEQQVDAALAAREAVAPVAPADEVPSQVTVILNGKSADVAYQPGSTLLETARRGGLRPPSSCEAGNCATCMAFLREGAVRMRANNALTPDEVEEGWVLTCQSVPYGPKVTVEYEAM